VFRVVLTPSEQEAGCCKQEAGISLETRPSSSSLSESEMTSGGFGTVAQAGLHCWTKPLGPGEGGGCISRRQQINKELL